MQAGPSPASKPHLADNVVVIVVAQIDEGHLARLRLAGTASSSGRGGIDVLGPQRCKLGAGLLHDLEVILIGV